MTVVNQEVRVPPSATGRERNPRGRGDLLRAQFVTAATELLGQVERPEQLTLRMVARVVGVSPASVYSHFADLDSLVGQVLLDLLEELTASVEAAVAATNSPEDGLLAACLAYTHWGLDHPGHYRVVFGGRIDPVLHDRVGGPTGSRLIDNLSRSLAEATTRAGNDGSVAEPSVSKGLLLWTSLHGLVVLRIDKQTLDWPPSSDHVVDMIAMFTDRPRAHLRAAAASMNAAGTVRRR